MAADFGLSDGEMGDKDKVLIKMRWYDDPR